MILMNLKHNEWVTLTQNTLNSVKDSIAKIKSSGASDEKITSIVDKAYDDFVKYTEIELAHTVEEVTNNARVFRS